MGGFGSGRHSYCGAKNTTEDYRSIDVRILHREGFLLTHKPYSFQWTRNGKITGSIQIRTEPGQIILTYSHSIAGGINEDKSYPVQLELTPCNFGGERPWFLCPANGCKRRVAILYGGAIFACRHCHELSYPSQREADFERALRRANKIRKQLGWREGILNPRVWRKPKGMHWRTFERLNTEYDLLVKRSLTGFEQQVNMLKNLRPYNR